MSEIAAMHLRNICFSSWRKGRYLLYVLSFAELGVSHHFNEDVYAWEFLAALTIDVKLEATIFSDGVDSS